MRKIDKVLGYALPLIFCALLILWTLYLNLR